jgi:hypothetical protein
MPTIVRLADHEIFPDTGHDVGPAIRQLISELPSSEAGILLLLDAGTYRMSAAAGNCIPLGNKRNLSIRGQGDETLLLVVSPAATCFQVEESSGVFITDLRVDYDPLPYTQGEVTSINASEGWFEVRIDPGFPLPGDEQFLAASAPYGTWGMIMNRSTRQLKQGAPDSLFHEKWQHSHGPIWRYFPIAEHRPFMNFITVGDAYVHLARSGGAVAHFYRTTNCGVFNLTVNSSPGTSVTGIAADGLKVHGLKVCFPKESGRLLTTDADGIHFQQGLIGPEIVGCTIEGTADDSVNIYYLPNTITSVNSTNEIVVRGGGFIETGDLLQIFDPVRGAVRGEARVSGVSDLPNGDKSIHLDSDVSGIVAGDVQGAVSTEGEKTGDTVYNLSRCGRGFVIRDNYFHSHRRHGIMIKAPGGVIENNRIEDVGGYGIVVGNDPGWPEGVCPINVVIRDNEIRRCAYGSDFYGASPNAAAIQIVTLSKTGLAEERLVSFITLQENLIEDPPGAAVYMGSAKEVRLSSGWVTYSENFTIPRSSPAVVIENSEGISVSDLSIRLGSGKPRAAIEVRAGTDFGDSGLRYSDLGIYPFGAIPEMIDVR